MTAFHVYHHLKRGTRAVKDSFSWTAMFFSFVWAFSHGLWMIGFVIVGFAILLIFLTTILIRDTADVLIPLLIAAGHIAIGVKGNDWRCANLEARGFSRVNIVRADTPDEAVKIGMEAMDEYSAKIAPNNAMESDAHRQRYAS